MKRGTIALLVVFGIALYIGFFWDQLDAVRIAVETVLDPTFGFLLGLNIYIGFIVTVAVLSLLITLAQKYLTDQPEIRKLKNQQKEIQKEMKQYKDDPKKQMEIQKKMWPIMPRMMHLTMRSSVFIAIPIVLFFRWFQEILVPEWGGWWFLYYIIATLVFSTIFRKAFKVA